MTSRLAAASAFSPESSPQLGFSLVEMAISLVVLTLLIGGLLIPLATQTEQRQYKETQRVMNEINEALIGYALAQTPPHLPCPDKTTAAGVGTANDGLEDFDASTGQCVAREGNVPWATLGVASADPWGNRFRYLVTPGFSNRPPATPVMSLASVGDIRVCSVASALVTCAPGTALASSVPAVVISHGKNGLGAVNSITNAPNPNPGSNDELENINVPVALDTSATNVVSHVISALGSPAGEFDDIVTWLPTSILFARLVSASKLP